MKMDLIVAQVLDLVGAEARLPQAFESLSENGSLMLIADWELSYGLKPLADSFFKAERALRNEIVWSVLAAGGQREKHATIFWFVKNARLAPFVELQMPKSRETIRRFGDGRIHSAVNPLTKRRRPTRIEGASTSTALNDVWVWDNDAGSWLSDLEELKGRGSANARVQAPTPERALLERLMGCSGFSGKPEAQVAHEIWSAPLTGA